MKTKYKDLTIWITGASSGIGQALAIAFAKRGARIILSGRDNQKLESVKKSCKRANRHIVIPFDISDAAQAKAAMTMPKLRLETLIGSSITPVLASAHSSWKLTKTSSVRLWR